MSLIISTNQARKALKVLDAMRDTGASGTFSIPNDLPNDTTKSVNISLRNNGEIVVCVDIESSPELSRRRVYPHHDAFYIAHFD